MRKFLPLAVMTGIMLNPFTAAYIKNDLYASFNMNEYELASENDDASNNSTHTYGYVANEWDNNAPVYESDFSLYNEIPYRFPDDMSVLKYISGYAEPESLWFMLGVCIVGTC